MRQTRTWAPVYVLLALLTLSNIVSNRLLPGWLYVPWNLAVAGAIVTIALRVDGRSVDELGLGATALARGVRLGAVIVGLVTVSLVLGAALPATRDLFDDARVEDLGIGGVLYSALVRVPFGTVALEEVAFRGVLPAVFAARTTTRRAVAASAGLFGLWHVLPSTNLNRRNPLLEDFFGEASWVVPVILAVVATAVAGVFLWWLRRWSGSLAAPALAHWSTNGLGYLLAYLVG